ncbi:MAG: UDP-2,3-diacylglucosamine pyrophosphatase LpxH [Frankiales bacterium]|nr:UDP-2,3-diacylglucosamine pyrophosphatase LpxH [Frankiales bacterium]
MLPSRVRRLGYGVAVVLVALVSAGTAVAAWGGSSRDIGPLETQLSLAPSLTGGITVGVPPLGRLGLDTHAGPLQVRATVTGIDPARARTLLGARNPGRVVTAQVTADSQDAVAAAATRALLLGLAASGVACALVFRRRRAVLGGTAAFTAVLAASAVVAGATLRTEALVEPRFDGLLVQAPALIGRVESFEAYSERVAQLTSNVARVYGSLATLPAAPGPESTRVLWVSDVHLNPQAFAVMAQLIEQFDVAAIVDTGDLTDLGSVPENRLISAVGTFGVPYLYVRGNHDSRAVTQSYVARQKGVRVLDDGDIVEVAGIRFAGTGDPTFTPNKQVKTEREADDERLRAAGEALRDTIDVDPAPVDVALVHQPKMAVPLFGKVPLVLDGHVHERGSRFGDGTLELTQGSSGGAGLRTLDRTEEALPLQMSILHFDADGELLAVDDVSVGGLGQSSVTVDRKSPASYEGSDPPPEDE